MDPALTPSLALPLFLPPPGRLFSVIWACRQQNNVMTKCMKTYMETNDDAASIAAAEKLRAEYASS